MGFAAVAEYGKQGYDLNPDPLALTDYYYSWKDSDGEGNRKPRGPRRRAARSDARLSDR